MMGYRRHFKVRILVAQLRRLSAKTTFSAYTENKMSYQANENQGIRLIASPSPTV